MKISQLLTAAAFSFAVGLTSSAQPAAASANARSEQPFVVHQRAWPSKAAFIQSGARCATRHVADQEAELYELIHGQLRAERANAKGGNGKGKPGGGGGGGGDAGDTSTVIVPV